MLEYDIPSNLQDLSVSIYQKARKALTKTLSDEKLFEFELLKLEIMGTLDFIKDREVPDDIAQRIEKMKRGGILISEILEESPSGIVHSYLLSIELARVWVINYFSQF